MSDIKETQDWLAELRAENERLRQAIDKMHDELPEIRERDILNATLDLKAENNTLREAAAFMYQYAGATEADVKVLDNLSALASGKPRPHEWEYPAGTREVDALKARAEKAEAALQSACDAFDKQIAGVGRALQQAEAELAARDATIAALREGIDRAINFDEPVSDIYTANFLTVTALKTLLADPDLGAKIRRVVEAAGVMRNAWDEYIAYEDDYFGFGNRPSEEQAINGVIDAVRALKPETGEGE